MPCWSHAELNVFAKQTLRTGKGLPTWMLKLETASCTATYHLTRPDGMDLSRRSRLESSLARALAISCSHTIFKEAWDRGCGRRLSQACSAALQ